MALEVCKNWVKRLIMNLSSGARYGSKFFQIFRFARIVFSLEFPKVCINFEHLFFPKTF